MVKDSTRSGCATASCRETHAPIDIPTTWHGGNANASCQKEIKFSVKNAAHRVRRAAFTMKWYTSSAASGRLKPGGTSPTVFP